MRPRRSTPAPCASAMAYPPPPYRLMHVVNMALNLVAAESAGVREGSVELASLAPEDLAETDPRCVVDHLHHLGVIDEDGAPRAERTVVLWNPELLDAELGLRARRLSRREAHRIGPQNTRRQRAAAAEIAEERSCGDGRKEE